MILRLWLASIAGTIALAGCGGGADSGGPAAAPPSAIVPPATPSPAINGKILGKVFAADTGKALANAQITVSGKITATANDGSFSQDGVIAGDNVIVRVSRDGYADGFASTRVTAGESRLVSVRLSPLAATTTFDNSVGGSIADSVTPARVVLAPGSVVNPATGALVQGAVKVQMAVIDPAANPLNMPGNYLTSSADRIESFGAVAVQLRDAANNRLNLATGTTASIRIPVASRSGTPPATIPLYYFDETTGLWVEQGSATLGGTAPAQYYEGSVSHFSYWNADRRSDTIFVNGCLSDPAGKPLGRNLVVAQGVDYTGADSAPTDAQGKFRLAVRRNSRAQVEVVEMGASAPVTVGPSAADITLNSCLVLNTAGAQAVPTVSAAPTSTTTSVGLPAIFYVTASGGYDVTYQWLRDGQPIIGATSQYFMLKAANAADDQTRYSVVVSNAVGSVTSAAATLTVTAALPPPGVVLPAADVNSLLKMTFLAANLYEMAYAPFDKFVTGTELWANPANLCTTGSASGSLNGQPIPVATTVAAGSGVVTGRFSQCVFADDTRTTYDGNSIVSYSVDAGFNNVTASAQITNFRISTVGDADFTGNGTVGLIATSSQSPTEQGTNTAITPQAGAVLLNNKTGQRATFVSGSTRIIVVQPTGINAPAKQTIDQQNLTFTFNGSTYVVSGTLTLTSAPRTKLTGSGQIVLSRDGKQIGRVYANALGDVYYEANGIIQPFSSAPGRVGSQGAQSR